MGRLSRRLRQKHVKLGLFNKISTFSAPNLRLMDSGLSLKGNILTEEAGRYGRFCNRLTRAALQRI
jgi:hypothetical protein